ncbi:MAG: sulfatase-like hydrolase/transferase [Sphingomonadales bacterium]|nr:sulfatase-like hydrolase/transferase [Sphingomonadales bacterium]MDE2570426.1 sulfatase-like hydrolase/transferase [Sphingomonadales bacterium]
MNALTTPGRRAFLGGAAALIGAGVARPLFAQAAPSATLPRAANGQPMNLILYFTDEMRADALACYGNPVTKTPNFDKLASEGALFRNCHVQNPVCAQSRCSMLTGWPTSVRGHRSLYYLLQDDEPNMFRYLRQAGYDVFWFGKNDALTPDAFADSVTEWENAMSPANLARSGMGAAMRNFDKNAPTTMLFPGGGDRRNTLDYPMVQDAIKVLERRESDRPFCIFLPLLEPHPPYTAPEGFDTMYNPSDLPALVPPGLPDKPLFHSAIRQRFGLDKVSDATLRKVRATYYGMVSYSDWLLGELMDAMERTGRDKDTALFVSSDHGDYAGDYGLIEKWPSGLESCLTHVPLIARVPGGKQGIVANDMVELYDIMATFLELGGTRATHTNFARSLMPQIAGGPGDPMRAAFSEGGYNIYEPQAFEPRLGGLYGNKTDLQNDRPETIERCASIKTQRHTYIARPSGVSELYDRQVDPMEEHNLFNARSHASIRDGLQRQLLDWYINTSGVPGTVRDARDMPPFYRNEVFPDAKTRAYQLLDD